MKPIRTILPFQSAKPDWFPGIKSIALLIIYKLGYQIIDDWKQRYIS